jgi:hypothetical protein
MPGWVTEGAVAVGADPYVQAERQKEVFDGDLSGAGILPVQVLFENRGDRRLLVRRSDILLELPDGTRLSPVGAMAAAARLDSYAGIGAAGFANVLTLGLAAPIYHVATLSEQRAREARLADFTQKELQDVTLEKDGSLHGFVFFIPPQGTPAFNEASLEVRIVDVEVGSTIVLRLPLMGLGFKGAPK